MVQKSRGLPHLRLFPGIGPFQDGSCWCICHVERVLPSNGLNLLEGPGFLQGLTQLRTAGRTDGGSLWLASLEARWVKSLLAAHQFFFQELVPFKMDLTGAFTM
jgi:hypothetical protein